MWDDDGGRFLDLGGSSDKIDVIKFQTSKAPVTTTWTSVAVNGRRATINLSYRVQCDPNWYRLCNVYCKPQNNYLGHYTCDSNGNRLCNIGWIGGNCDQGQSLLIITGNRPVVSILFLLLLQLFVAQGAILLMAIVTVPFSARKKKYIYL